MIIAAAPPLQTIRDDVTEAAGVHLRLLRLDLIHPLLQGNKWYKLRLNLEEAARQRPGQGQKRDQENVTLLSFGGAWSNHLRALAAAGSLHGFRTIGVVRGELPQPLNPVLAFARQQGMILHPVERSSYRQKHSEAFLAGLRQQFGDFFLIPEGGANVEGALGCKDIVSHLQWSVAPVRRHLLLACGTGTTLAGILHGIHHDPRADCRVTGVAVVKGIGINGESFLQADVRQMLQRLEEVDPLVLPLIPPLIPPPQRCDWHIEAHWHCGGYARTTPELLASIANFQARHDVPLEPVYTGKMIHGLYRRLREGGFERGSEIIAIHTGGIHPR